MYVSHKPRNLINHLFIKKKIQKYAMRAWVSGLRNKQEVNSDILASDANLANMCICKLVIQTLCDPHGPQPAKLLLVPPPGDPPDSGIEPVSLVSPVLAGRFFITAPPGKHSQLNLWNSCYLCFTDYFEVYIYISWFFYAKPLVQSRFL